MIIDRHAQLKALHLHGMAAAWQEWQAEGNTRQKPVMPEIWLDRLIAAEQLDRKVRSLNYQLHIAKFPHHRDLIHFDWTENPLTKERIEQLSTGKFMIQANNLIFVGGTGTGETHLAIALAVSAIHQGKRVRFYNAVDPYTPLLFMALPHYWCRKAFFKCSAIVQLSNNIVLKLKKFINTVFFEEVTN